MTDPERMSDEEFEKLSDFLDGELRCCGSRTEDAAFTFRDEAKRAREGEASLIVVRDTNHMILEQVQAENAALRDRLDSQDFDALHKANEKLALVKAIADTPAWHYIGVKQALHRVLEGEPVRWTCEHRYIPKEYAHGEGSEESEGTPDSGTSDGDRRAGS